MTIGRRLVRVASFLAVPIGQEAMIEDGVKPAAHVALGPAQMPARERALESILDEIIGALCIAA